MKKFLAIYTGTPESRQKKWGTLSAEEQKLRTGEGIQAWGAWGARNSASIKESGGPLGKTKRVDEKGISDVANSMAAYVVIEAESHEEAAQKFLNHPHFSIFPGEAVEIMECLPIPKG